MLKKCLFFAVLVSLVVFASASFAAPKYTWKKAWGIPTEAVPNVVGMSQAAAIAALKAGDWEYEVTSGFSDAHKAGVVASQSPAGGAKADPTKTVVTIVISKGPDPNKPKPPPPPPPSPDPTTSPEPTSTP